MQTLHFLWQVPEVLDEGSDDESDNKSDDENDDESDDGSEDECEDDDESDAGWYNTSDSEESVKPLEAALELVGPSNSHYVMYHSKSATFTEAHQDKPRGKVVHLQEFSGINATTLLEDASKFVGRSMLVMCSHSLQDEDSTTTALYQVSRFQVA